MGLPEINIEFSGKAVSAVKRSALGIVALIVKDDTGTFTSKEIKDVTEVLATDFTAENQEYIKQALQGTPSKVIVERLDTLSTDYTAALTRLASKRFNYLAIPEITTAETADVVSWIKAQRSNKKTFKAVLPNVDADHEAIINFATEGIKVGATTYSASQYTARIAGILAGLPFTRSSTYFVLNEVESIIESTDPNADIDAGKFILVNDGEKIKVGRGVNSLVTTTTDKTEDFKSIKIVEVMDMMHDDVRNTFDNQYVGKVNNIYDNQVLFINAVNSYFDTLEGDEILDPNINNFAEIDVNAQRLAWEAIGTDTTEWNDQTVKENAFKKNVFLGGTVRIVDAMEDLLFKISI